MKKTSLIVLFICFCRLSYSQWLSNDNSIATDKNVTVNGNIFARNLLFEDNSRITTSLTDNSSYKNRVVGNYAIQWTPDDWHIGANTLYVTSWGGIRFFTQGLARLSISNEGNVGIGNDNPKNKLDVAGDVSGQNIIMGNGYKLTPFITDNSSYKNREIGNYAIQWTPDDWHDSAHTLYMTGFGGIRLFTEATPRLSITKEGNVGIGIENPKNKLDVAGIIRAKEVIIETGWADFVFDKDYKLPSLSEVESHIEEHKHLPGIPSESEVKENGGVGLGEMQVKLLQKIEELTLYVIEQNKKIDLQNQRIEELEKTQKQ